MSYLNAGGNVIIGSRYGSRVLAGDLEDYAHIDSWDQVEISIPGLTAVAGGLQDQPGAGISLTDLPVMPTHEEVTLLYTVAGFPLAAGGILVEPESGGKLAYIAGRPYRYDLDISAANYDYMLTTYFGED